MWVAMDSLFTIVLNYFIWISFTIHSDATSRVNRISLSGYRFPVIAKGRDSVVGWIELSNVNNGY